MSSKSRSSKRHSPSHSSLDDSPANDVVTPKHEFVVEEDAREAYYRALCGSLPPLQDIPIPRRPLRPPGAPFTPSMVSPKYLTILRNFYQVPSGVTYRIPTGDESARNPPQGFFTCYEAFLAYFCMWFPIPGAIVRALYRFELSISQLNVSSLESWLGVLISSYELWMDLNPGEFEGLWCTRPTGIDGSYSMVTKKDMAIIQGTTSNPKSWFDRFFFVRIDGESVEESCLHLFPQEWNFNLGNTTSFAFGFYTSKVCEDKNFRLLRSEQDPSANPCRSFRQARSSSGKAVFLEYLFCRTDSKCGGAPSIPSHSPASRCSVRCRAGC
ncbi:hypothetical protein Bca101_057907 [Brassica carinata]